MSVVPVNYLGFAVASVSQFFFGGLWYSALPTSGFWLRGMQKYLGDTKWPTSRKDTNVSQLFIAEIFLIAIRTYVTHHFLHYMRIKSLADSLKLSFWLWLGYSFPQLSHDNWQGLPTSVRFVNHSCDLIRTSMATAILFYFNSE